MQLSWLIWRMGLSVDTVLTVTIYCLYCLVHVVHQECYLCSILTTVSSILHIDFAGEPMHGALSTLCPATILTSHHSLADSRSWLA